MPCLATAATQSFVVIIGEKNVGHLKADVQGTRAVIDFDFKDNGRGPTLAETITTDASGLPTAWTITGATTFGSKVSERFALTGNAATWTDPIGTGSTTLKEPSIYVAQGASPWALGLYARALLRDADRHMPALPSGSLRLEQQGNALTVSGAEGQIRVTAYALTGINLTPDYILLDAQSDLFAFMTADFVIVRQGYEGEEKRLRAVAAKMSTDNYVRIEKEVAHKYDAPVRVRNVRLFDPSTGKLTEPRAVVVSGKRIAAVEAIESPGTPGEVTIDGAGGTLVPGMYEMHGHLVQDEALLNVVAGVTSLRDMGNDNAVLDELSARIDSGMIGGPRITRSGFLEGKSPFNSNSGIVVDSEQAAIDAVRWYGARGYWQIKIYNSMDPAWVPAIVKEAHRLGMRVAGHVPAFSTANAMIEAGYDEITHINWIVMQAMPDNVINESNGIMRFEGPGRFAKDLDLNGKPITDIVSTMAAKGIYSDPTMVAFEGLYVPENGDLSPAFSPFVGTLPPATERSFRTGGFAVPKDLTRADYRASWAKMVALLGKMHKAGVPIVAGTDGAGIELVRELEIYVEAGFTPAEALATATLAPAKLVGQEKKTGSIQVGKTADLVLVEGDPSKRIGDLRNTRVIMLDGKLLDADALRTAAGFSGRPKSAL